VKLERAIELYQQLQREWGVEDYKLIFFTDNYKNETFGASAGVLGYCHVPTKTIGILEPYVKLNDEAFVLDTLRHEVAHALACSPPWEDGHDEVWRDMCKLVGAVPDPISCTKDRIYPVEVFGTYWFCWLTNWVEKHIFGARCSCFKCTYGVEKY
jgi:hypothetical protein